MRIGLMCQSFDDRTGIGRIASALAGEYAARGHEVCCIAQRFEMAIPNTRRHPLSSVSFSNALSKLAFRAAGSPPIGKADVDLVHTFGVGRGAQVVAAQSCHRAGLAKLRELRSIIPEWRSPGLYDYVSLADEKALVTSPVTRRVIATSDSVKADLLRHYARYGLAEGKVQVVPNGVHAAKFSAPRRRAEREGVRRSLGLGAERFVFLFVGNEFGRKGLWVLLKALSALQERAVHLLVLGRGPQELYRGIVREMGIVQAVTFLGAVPEPERIFSAADAFVLPSLYEPFGMAILEAMAAGLPVVASRACGAVARLSGGEHAILLDDPASAEELAAALRVIAGDDALRSGLSAAGAVVASDFSWQRIAYLMLNVYEEVLQER